VNAGVPGYSTRQMRQTVEEVAPELRPQVIVFAVAGENYWRVDRPYVLVRGYLIRTDFLPDVHWGREGVYYSPISRWPWLRELDLWMNEHFELGAHLLAVTVRAWGRIRRPPPLVVPVAAPVDPGTAGTRLAPTLREIEQADSIGRSSGFSVVVLLVNSQQADGSFRPDQFTYNRVLRTFCESRGIRVVDPLPILVKRSAGMPVFRTPVDYHWSREAHRVVAEELDRYLLEAGLIPGSRLPSSGSIRRP